MKLAELLRAVNSLVQTGGAAHQYETLAVEAEKLADMVVWANEPIDPDGQWLNRLAALQDDLVSRVTEDNGAAVLTLNGRLTLLGHTISQHDDDIEKGGTGEDDDEYF